MDSLKTSIITIETPAEGQRPNRDAGKTYLVKEMPALMAERWGRHAVAACSRSDLDLKGELAKLGLLGFYLVGFQALAGGDIDAVDKLMDQMLTRFKIVQSETVARQISPDPDSGDIEEVSTLIRLRKELIELSMGFTFAEIALILGATSANQPDSQNTQTSQT